MDKPIVTTDLILNTLRDLVESKKIISREVWLDAAFKLNLLQLEESQFLHKMQQEIAKRKSEILNKQEKKNVSAAELELEATDEYRFMKDQENKVETIKEFIRIAKKNSETAF